MMLLFQPKQDKFPNDTKLSVNHRSHSESKYFNDSNVTKKSTYHYQNKPRDRSKMMSPPKEAPVKLQALRTQSHQYLKYQDKEIKLGGYTSNDANIKALAIQLPHLKIYHQRPPVTKLPSLSTSEKIKPQKYNAINSDTPMSISQVNRRQLKDKLMMYDDELLRTNSLIKLPKQNDLQFMNKNPSNNTLKEILFNYASLSKAGFEDHKQKINQDRDLIYIKSASGGAFGIMDGHGQEGEKVSQFITDSMKYMLSHLFDSFNFLKVFPELHNQLKCNTEIGSQFSGTTATLVIIKDNMLQCGWVGDSRAILGRKKSHLSRKIDFLELSKDHKPDNPLERERIEKSGGFVDNYHSAGGECYGPYRVWLKGAQYPGLAMSRSLGDEVAASVGVSQIPDVVEVELMREDLFLIVASDGIWEFVTNQQAVNIVYPYYVKNDPQGACEQLYYEAYGVWKQHEFDDRIDDISSIVVFLNRE